MSLAEKGQTRYNRAIDFLGTKLAPSLQKQHWKIRPWLFAETAKPAGADDLNTAGVDGKRTNLAGALFQAATAEAESPVAIVALTDGEANDPADNTRAVSALLDRAVPVYGIGFGSDSGPPTLAMDKVTAPSVVPAKQQFRVEADLSLSGSVDVPAFELMLLRDGQLAQTKTVNGFNGSRSWSEVFSHHRERRGPSQLHDPAHAAESRQPDCRPEKRHGAGQRFQRKGPAHSFRPGDADMGLQIHFACAAWGSGDPRHGSQPHVGSLHLPAECGEGGRTHRWISDESRAARAVPGGWLSPI